MGKRSSSVSSRDSSFYATSIDGSKPKKKGMSYFTFYLRQVLNATAVFPVLDGQQPKAGVERYKTFEKYVVLSVEYRLLVFLNDGYYFRQVAELDKEVC